jgi:VCBS repeat-containing protein
LFFSHKNRSKGENNVATTAAKPAPSPTLAINDTAITNENTAININVLANDLNPKLLIKSLYSLAQSGTAVVTTATSKLGATIKINPDGTVYYDPTLAAAFQSLAQGETTTDTFIYTMKEANASGKNSTLSTATVTVTLTGVNDAPVITGTTAGQTTTDIAAIHPFSNVVVTDVDHDALESATITLLDTNGNATDANGLLSGTGLVKTGTGTYILAAASPSSLTSELEQITFTPTAHEVTSGTITTSFKLAVSDGFAAINDNTTSTVVSGTAFSTVAGTQFQFIDLIPRGQVLASAGSRTFDVSPYYTVTETADGFGHDGFTASPLSDADYSIILLNSTATGDSYSFDHFANVQVDIRGTAQSLHMADSVRGIRVTMAGSQSSLIVDDISNGIGTNVITDYGSNDTITLTALHSAGSSATILRGGGDTATLTILGNDTGPISHGLEAYGLDETMRFIGSVEGYLAVGEKAVNTTAYGGDSGNHMLIQTDSSSILWGGSGVDTFVFSRNLPDSLPGWQSIIENFDAAKDILQLPSNLQNVATFAYGADATGHPTTVISQPGVTATITVIGAALDATTVQWNAPSY